MDLMNTQEIIKKAILDSQERVRDFMNYSESVEDDRLRKCFREFAETEGKQAHRLGEFLDPKRR